VNEETGEKPVTDWPFEEGEWFDIQAQVGVTKHAGSRAATDELAQLCHIIDGSYVLDVGCGVGLTPSYLAKRYGCRVMGVDIRESMVERSREQALAQGVTELTEFQVADAMGLPFDEGTFDVVLSESVLAMVADKAKALSEYLRVLKSGGYIGLNETAWLREPDERYRELMRQSVQGDTLTVEAWAKLAEQAGLNDLQVRRYEISVLREVWGYVQRMGLRNLVQTSMRARALAKENAEYRAFVKRGASVPKEMAKTMGYVIIVGRK
jgi:arsenite methyltransferase